MNASTARKALNEIERSRRAARLSIREAARRAGYSDGTWRQLIAGEVMQGGRKVKRIARPDQILLMAAAVGTLESIAELIGASGQEVTEARARVVIPDPAEEEIMNIRHLSTAEKLILIQSLQDSRGHDVGSITDRSPDSAK